MAEESAGAMVAWVALVAAAAWQEETEACRVGKGWQGVVVAEVGWAAHG